MFGDKPGLKEKMNFFRLLSVAQKAGLGIRESLLAIRLSEKNSKMKEIMSDLIDNISGGEDLSNSMEHHKWFFSTSEIEIVRSAQVSGNMVETLQEVYIQLEDSNKINSKVKKAMTYPAILIIFSFIAIVVLLTKVIPTIVSLFPNQESLPSITVFVLGLSDFFQAYWYVILIFIVGIYGGFKFMYSNSLSFKMFVDQLLLRIPVLKDMVMGFYVYRFSILLGQFYKAGLSPVVSLGLIANIFDNFEYKKKVLKVKKDVSAGFSFFESMEGSKLFDPILVQILHVGEETGTIGVTMQNISGYYKDNLQSKIDAFMALLEPLLIAGVAIIIGVLIASVFLPMTTLLEVIG